jgi:hypothetical protein
MIRIAICQAAFDAIARTIPFGSVNFEAGVDFKQRWEPPVGLIG